MVMNQTLINEKHRIERLEEELRSKFDSKFKLFNSHIDHHKRSKNEVSSFKKDGKNLDELFEYHHKQVDRHLDQKRELERQMNEMIKLLNE